MAGVTVKPALAVPPNLRAALGTRSQASRTAATCGRGICLSSKAAEASRGLPPQVSAARCPPARGQLHTVKTARLLLQSPPGSRRPGPCLYPTGPLCPPWLLLDNWCLCPPKLMLRSRPQSRMLMTFGGGASGRYLGLDEVVKVGPHDSIREFT